MMTILLFLSVLNIGENIELTPKDTLPIQNETFWEKLIFEVGYSGEVCGTGKYLRKYDGGGFLDLIAQRLYRLNSVGGSVSYPVKDKWEGEVGLGYGWTNIKITSSDSYDFEMYLFSLGLACNKHILRISYINSRSTQITGSEDFNYYYGNGKGGKISYYYMINKSIGLSISSGKIWYIINRNNQEYKFNQYLNGIGFFIGYRFNF
jgi:hypothetical protein